jgi:hypothetical protein
MTPVALLTRHWLVAGFVFLAAIGVGLGLTHSTPLYASTATVAFDIPRAMQKAGTPISGDNLIVTVGVLADTLSAPTVTGRVYGAAGGGAQYQFGLVNFYDQEYPNYAQPLATLQATSFRPDAARRTFEAAYRAMQQRLAAQQAAAGALPGDYITANIVRGSSQPIPQSGYPKRTYIGVFFLGLVSAYFTALILERNPARLAWLLARLHLPRPKAA